MLIDGNVVHYLLAQEFTAVSCDKAARRIAVDYPILYDVSADMSGHTVLVPEHERPRADARLSGSICLCTNDASAAATREAGFAVVQIGDDVTFPHLYNYLQLGFVRLERLDARLRAYVETRMGAQALLDACSEALGRPLALMDEQYRTITEVTLNGSAAFSLLEEEGVDLFMAARNYRHMRSSRTVFTAPGSGDLLMKNLFAGGELIGMVMSYHEGTALSARYTRFILSYVSSFLEETFERMGSFGVETAEADRIRETLSRLLPGGTTNRVEIESLLLKNGHAPRSTYVVLRIERSFTYEGAEELGYLAHRFESAWSGAYCFVVDATLYMLSDIHYKGAPRARDDVQDWELGRIDGPTFENDAFALANHDAAGKKPVHEDFLKDILIVARDNLAKVGVSREFTDLGQLDAARAQATAALQQGLVSDPTYWFYRFDDYALSWVVEHGLQGTPAGYAQHPAVAELARYDAEHESELLHTLTVFLRCRFNATRAADELYVARSTLLARLERITTLTGIDLDDPDDLVYLGLSLARK